MREIKTLLAIDPGPTVSGVIRVTGTLPRPTIIEHATLQNRAVLNLVESADDVVIEMVQTYGSPVGQSTFGTCVWVGAFMREFGWPENAVHLIYRPEVLRTVCLKGNANPAVIRQALIDRYGPDKQTAIGTRKNPGPLLGVDVHQRAALALALAYMMGASLAET